MNLDDIRNYYEQLVQNYLIDTASKKHNITDEDLLEDIACIALNQLPARYIRHEVDMAFFLTTTERDTMRNRVVEAVEHAIEAVESRKES